MNTQEMLQSEFMFTRVLTMSISAFVIAIQSGNSLIDIPKKFRFVLALRGIASITSLFGIMIGMRTLPLTIFMLIINTNSFTTGLLQYFRLGKPIEKFEILSMIGCYAGIVLIAVGSDTSSTVSVGTPHSLLIGFCATFVSAVSISVSSVTIYEMRELHFSVIQFH